VLFAHFKRPFCNVWLEWRNQKIQGVSVKRVLFLVAIATVSLNAATLATVNGEKITSEEINLLLSQNPQMPKYEQIDDENKKKILEDVIERKLLAQQAKKSGIEKDSKYKMLLNALQENLTAGFYATKKSEAIKITDAEAQKFYDENKDRLARPAQVRARHILVEKEADAKAIIKSLSGKKGADLENAFIAAAKEKGTDGTKDNGGDLGYFTQEKMVSEFSNAAFAMKKGDLSKTPVKSKFGYHVIYLVDKQESGITPFADVKDEIKNMLKSQKFEAELKKEIEDLRAKAKISYE
jgi:peptidylprolyl isomerase